MLFDTFAGLDGADTLWTSLILEDRAKLVWQQQERHIACIQDVPGVTLYTKMDASVTIHEMDLPVYRCGRGTTSLEPFHLHLQRFNPG